MKRNFIKGISCFIIACCLLYLTGYIVVFLDNYLLDNHIIGEESPIRGFMCLFTIITFYIYFGWAMGMSDVDVDKYPKTNHLTDEQRQILKKYVKSKMRESIKEYQQDTKYREVKQIERDRDIREVCLMRAGYQCEINSEHTSFTTSNGRQYVESHHIIPLKYQDQFDFNLDAVENLIALCPNCHKAIHYGSRKTKEILLKQIHNIRPVTEYKKLLSFYE